MLERASKYQHRQTVEVEGNLLLSLYLLENKKWCTAYQHCSVPLPDAKCFVKLKLYDISVFVVWKRASWWYSILFNLRSHLILPVVITLYILHIRKTRHREVK